MKNCRTENFREKVVVDTACGKRLGYVCEVEFDICSGKITAIVVKEEGGFFGKGKKDLTIPWCNIEKIGEDIILVRTEGCLPPPCLPDCDCGDGKKNFQL